MDQNYLSLHRHPKVSLEVVEVGTVLILLENQRDLLIELDVPVSRWMFSVPDLFQNEFFSSICDWEYEFTIFFGNIPSFALSLEPTVVDAPPHADTTLQQRDRLPCEVYAPPAQAPVVEYITPAVLYVTPAPVAGSIAPAVSYAVPAPVAEYIAIAPEV